MDSITDVYDTLSSIEISVPASEMIFLMVALTCCLLLRVPRIGILVSFLGTYRWGWIVFRREFHETHPFVLYVYFGLGLVVVVLAILTWWFAEE
ncbi:MAG TPA: hypothetical protein VIH35_02410 [Kiritimatiellia bacterium]|jgi:hypothetical protein